MKRLTLITIAVLFPILTSACNMMSGLGEDISRGGQKLQKAADRHIHPDDSTPDAPQNQ